jgi:hypothetical protein
MASNSVAFNPCDSGSINTKTNLTTWNSLTFNSTTTVSGTFTDTINPITPLVNCYYVNGFSDVTISKAILNNCECCNLTIKNPGKQQFNESRA